MTIYVITYSDGYDTCNVFIDAYEDQTTAELKALELQEKLSKHSYGGYTVDPVELK